MSLADTSRMAAGRLDRDTIQTVFLDGLRNAHAVEKQAVELIERQLQTMSEGVYPEVERRMRQHLDETNRQIDRLDTILRGFDTSNSTLKDVAMQMMGNMAALFHAPADDAILKNSFANLAFENFEAAAYKSLITVADLGGYGDARSMLQQSLSEEQAMAKWIDDNIETVTRRYIEQRSRGERT